MDCTTILLLVIAVLIVLGPINEVESYFFVAAQPIRRRLRPGDCPAQGHLHGAFQGHQEQA